MASKKLSWPALADALTNVPQNSADFPIVPRTLDELLKMPPEQLRQVDIGVMNLLCAQGLPGSEHLDMPACMQLLAKWTELARIFTQQNYYRFRRDPAEFEYSEVYYRLMMLAMFLQQELHVQYNPNYTNMPLQITERDREFFSNSSNCFIHGILSQERYGTCGTMPVLECAIGQRLGYPMQLVSAKGHFFARWQETDGWHTNIECTSRGLALYSDEHYRHWPEEISDEEVRRGDYLQNLTPKEELAAFLGQRSCVQATHLIVWAAFDSLVRANKLAPRNQSYRDVMAFYVKTLDQQEMDWRQDMQQQTPRDPSAEIQFLDDFGRNLAFIKQIEHDMRNPATAN